MEYDRAIHDVALYMSHMKIKAKNSKITSYPPDYFKGEYSEHDDAQDRELRTMYRMWYDPTIDDNKKSKYFASIVVREATIASERNHRNKMASLPFLCLVIPASFAQNFEISDRWRFIGQSIQTIGIIASSTLLLHSSWYRLRNQQQDAVGAYALGMAHRMLDPGEEGLTLKTDLLVLAEQIVQMTQPTQELVQ